MSGTGQPLTVRELQVARLAAEGRTASNVGRQLGVSAATVRVHLNSIYAKRGSGDSSGHQARRNLAFWLKLNDDGEAAAGTGGTRGRP